ncbi:MAG: hypothetical protein K2X99_04190 [Gemmatimonadaceae bacterium]|nr:hypothetical protein [Gemmatimonadaceae bacterium]
MRLETFRGRDLASVFHVARQTLGDDVIIAHSRSTMDGRGDVEVIAAAGHEVARVRRLLATPEARRTPRRRGAPPFTIALVGPTGAGKTTTAAKLAVHPDAFGGMRVGLLLLDTFRAGALEQLAAYADIAECPLEVAYDARDVGAALRRLDDCDVVIVDTPGRSPRADGPGWRDLLAAIRPDETHLVVPVTARAELTVAWRTSFAALGLTHCILSKLDEVPEDAMLASIAGHVDLPVRWITDGQRVPEDLRGAASVVWRAFTAEAAA